LSSAAFQQTG